MSYFNKKAQNLIKRYPESWSRWHGLSPESAKGKVEEAVRSARSNYILLKSESSFSEEANFADMEVVLDDCFGIIDSLKFQTDKTEFNLWRFFIAEMKIRQAECSSGFYLKGTAYIFAARQCCLADSPETAFHYVTVGSLIDRLPGQTYREMNSLRESLLPYVDAKYT